MQSSANFFFCVVVHASLAFCAELVQLALCRSEQLGVQIWLEAEADCTPCGASVRGKAAGTGKRRTSNFQHDKKRCEDERGEER